MKKNKKQNNQQSISRPHIDMPYVVDMDSLAYASDDDLWERYGYLNLTRDQAIKAGMDPYPWEIELAYIQRENGIRDSRKLAHEKYIKLNPEDFIDSYDQGTGIDHIQAGIN